MLGRWWKFLIGDVIFASDNHLLLIVLLSWGVMSHFDNKMCFFHISVSCTFIRHEPASRAQLDARPTSNQEVAGSTPAGSARFFRGDLILKYFLRSISPFRWFKKGSCHFLGKECAQSQRARNVETTSIQHKQSPLPGDAEVSHYSG